MRLDPRPGPRPLLATASPLASYLGNCGTFAQAIAEFAEKYANQNDRDHPGVKDGRAQATTNI